MVRTTLIGVVSQNGGARSPAVSRKTCLISLDGPGNRCAIALKEQGQLERGSSVLGLGGYAVCQQIATARKGRVAPFTSNGTTDFTLTTFVLTSRLIRFIWALEVGRLAARIGQIGLPN